MKKPALVLLGIILSCLAQAQVEFGERYEQKHNWLKDNYLVISNDEQGVLLVQADYDGSSKKYPLFLSHLDTELKRVWSDTLDIPTRFFVKGYFYAEKRSYLLLQNTHQHSVKVLRVDTQKKELKEFDSKELAELNITEFEVVKNTAIIGGYFEERPVVFAYDLIQNKVRTLQNVYQNDSDLLEVKINKDSISFNVLASIKDENKDRAIVVNTYDYEGNPLRDYTIHTRPDYELINGVSSSINDISQVVVGMYGYKSNYAVSGLYVNYVDRTGTQTMNFYNFGELPRFLDYLGEKRANKQKAKALNMKKEGKELRYKASAMMRELIEKDGKLVFTGEFFKTYTQDNNVGRLNQYGRLNSYNNFNNLYNSYDQWQSNTTQVQESDVTHAYTLVLNQQGEIQWDNYMEIDENITGGMNEFGSFQWLGERAAYIYYHDKELFMKILDEAGESEMLTTSLELMDETDELRLEKDESLGTVRWYDNHYLVYGIQHVRSSDKSEPLRKVFFINKVSATNAPVASRID
ncbi:MAG: hypothetical protein HEP71_17700 [Roseivirga sp.]|nr:hypothetical protein [Roseivirga sp.]